MTTLRSSTRGHIALGKEIARGGEGRINELAGDSNFLVKTYLRPQTKAKIAKLKAMVSTPPNFKAELAAWPIETVANARGETVGFIMKRVSSKQDAHQLYSPKSRALAFPEADFRFLVHVAANLANAFGAIHRAGVVVGDVNHASTLVGADGTVSLVDCDSFQFTENNNVHACDAGSPLYLPPELQNLPLRGRPRSVESDHFSLAILIFHLLFMGRHPFAGIYSGPDEMPIEKAIAQSRFAYSRNGAQTGMKRPPGTLALETHGPEIASLFERAFSKPNGIVSRPGPSDWVKALNDLKESLIPCVQSTSHHYWRSAGKCPWCELELATPIRLFGHKFVPTGTALLNVENLWNAILAVAPPPDAVDPRIRTSRPPPEPQQKLSRTIQTILAIACLVVGLFTAQAGGLVVGLIFAFLIWPRIDQAKLTALNGRLRAATAKTVELWNEWDRRAKSQAFNERRRELERTSRALRHLPAERNQALQSLEERKREIQLSKYLDKFDIAKGNVSLIGPSRAATLASYGIETAADVSIQRIESIAGFGPRMAANLVQWRQGLERGFRFDPTQPTDPQDIAEVERKIFEKRVKLLRELERGPLELKRLAVEIMDARRRLLPALEAALKEEEAAYKAVEAV